MDFSQDRAFLNNEWMKDFFLLQASLPVHICNLAFSRIFDLTNDRKTSGEYLKATIMNLFTNVEL